MLKNYVRTLARQLQKFRLTYGITVVGLGVGLATCLVCFLHIQFERSHDKFHVRHDRLYRLVNGDPNTVDHWVKTAPPIPPKLKSDLPEVEDFVRLHPVTYRESVVVERGKDVFLEPFFLMADPNFFKVFSFPLIVGDPASVLQDLNNVVISRATATRLFGTTDPVGKSVRLKDNQLDFIVSGVFEDFPVNTHLRCDYMVSFENLNRVFGQGSSESWGQYNYFGYLLLHAGADPAAVSEKMRQIQVNVPGRDVDLFKSFYLQPVTDIHFTDNRGNLLPSYDVRYLFIFATMAISVLVICLMNYVNLSAMLSLRRIKEIGVRKIVGATARQLITQFLAESISLTILSLFLCMLLVEVLQQPLTSFLGSPVEIPYSNPEFHLMIVVVVFLLITVTGGYMMLYVHRLRPNLIARGGYQHSSEGRTVQHGLMFLQLSLASIMLIGSVVIVRQMRHLQNKNLGFDKDQVVMVSLPRGILPATLSSLRSSLGGSAVVEGSAFSDFIPGRPNWNQTTWWEGQTEPESMNVIVTDRDFPELMRLDMVEGSFAEIIEGKEIQFMINEAARTHIGWTEGRGKFLSPFGENQKRPISGVVRDFNFRSLHHEVAPLVLAVYPERSFSQWFVRLKGDRIQEGIKETESAFRSLLPENPFSFRFVDEAIDKLYAAELRMERIVVVLTAVSVVFSLLGIFALISFAIENRLKEVAIRKVLGVSPRQLISLFIARYVWLVALAGFAAAPVCWIFANDWLSHFNEKVIIHPLSFVAVIASMLVLVALIGIFKYASLRGVNPAITLKSE